jgi:hypothetical protein
MSASTALSRYPINQAGDVNPDEIARRPIQIHTIHPVVRATKTLPAASFSGRSALPLLTLLEIRPASIVNWMRWQRPVFELRSSSVRGTRFAEFVATK